MQCQKNKRKNAKHNFSKSLHKVLNSLEKFSKIILALKSIIDLFH